MGKGKKRAASPEVFHVGSSSPCRGRIFGLSGNTEVITKARVAPMSSDEEDNHNDSDSANRVKKKDKKGKGKAKKEKIAEWVRQGLSFYCDCGLIYYEQEYLVKVLIRTFRIFYCFLTT
jgi:hypothetical protein